MWLRRRGTASRCRRPRVPDAESLLECAEPARRGQCWARARAPLPRGPDGTHLSHLRHPPRAEAPWVKPSPRCSRWNSCAAEMGGVGREGVPEQDQRAFILSPLNRFTKLLLHPAGLAGRLRCLRRTCGKSEADGPTWCPIPRWKSEGTTTSRLSPFTQPSSGERGPGMGCMQMDLGVGCLEALAWDLSRWAARE